MNRGSAPPEHPPAQRRARPGWWSILGAGVLLLLLLLLLFFLIRAPLFLSDFPNPDIAGITYNADLILRGGLPYVGSLEVKAPGTFFVVAGLFATFGRSLEVLQLAHSAWLLVGAWAVWLAAQELYGRDEAGRLSAAVGAAVYLLYAGMFTYNYSSWMMPAYAWAFAAGLRSLRDPGWRWALVAGGAAMGATLLKLQGAVAFPLLGALWLWGRRQGLKGARGETVGAWICGAMLPLLLLAAPYGLAGELPSLIDGLLPLTVAREYSGGPRGTFGALGLAWRVVLQLGQVLPVAAALCVCAGMGCSARWRTADSPLTPVLLFVAASLLGVGMGGARFYLHYLVQYVPAVSLLAGHPHGLRFLRAAWGPRPWASRLGAAAVAATVGFELWGVATGDAHRYESMARTLADGRTAGQAAGEHIRARTVPGDTIFAWGWTAWPVYYWAERGAPTRVYKALGTLTTFNTNSEFFEGGPIVFRPGLQADLVLKAFEQRRPAYFVYSSSYLATFGCEVDPLKSWTALGAVLRREYRAEAQYGDIVVFGRR